MDRTRYTKRVLIYMDEDDHAHLKAVLALLNKTLSGWAREQAQQLIEKYQIGEVENNK